MTNYENWSKIDENKLIEEIDIQDKIESYKKSRELPYIAKHDKIQEIKESADITAEILASKAAVEMLKAQGVMHRRKKHELSTKIEIKLEPETTTTTTTDITTFMSTDSEISPLNSSINSINNERKDKFIQSIDEIHSESNKNTISKAIQLIQDLSVLLGELLEIIEKLHTMLEDNSKHVEGYWLGLDSFRKLKMFNKKNAYVMSGNLFAKESDRSHNHFDAENMYNSIQSASNEMQSSGKYIACQLSEYVSTFAFRIGEYAVACDISRYYLKYFSSPSTSTSPPSSSLSSSSLIWTGTEQVWLIRSLSFAAMGNASLAKSHCYQARILNVSYHDISTIESYLADMELQEAKKRVFHKNIEMDVIESINRTLFLSRLSLSNQKNYPILPSLSIISIHHFEQYFNTNAYIPKDGSVISIHRFLLDVLEDPNKFLGIENIDECIQSIFTLMRRTFYEAQILYLESVFYSAEIKYWTVIWFIDLFRQYRSIHDKDTFININISINTDTDMKMNTVLISCLLNIINCHLQRKSSSKIHDYMMEYSDYYPSMGLGNIHRIIPIPERWKSNKDFFRQEANVIKDITYESIELTMKMSTIELCYLTLNIYDNPASRFRLISILQNMGRLDEALNEIKVLRNLLSDINYLIKTTERFLFCHYSLNLFSQRYIIDTFDLHEIIGFHDEDESNSHDRGRNHGKRYNNTNRNIHSLNNSMNIEDIVIELEGDSMNEMKDRWMIKLDDLEDQIKYLQSP